MVNIFLLVLFCTFIILLGYVYAGYPVLLRILYSFVNRNKPDKIDFSPVPAISIIVPAYNEEKSIAEKIENILTCDYPVEKREIIVISDCSSDRTDEIVEGYRAKGIKLVRLTQRTGKVAAYKKVVPTCSGEILIFTDATSVLKSDALKKIVRKFADPAIGCVGGYLRFVPIKNSTVGQGENDYWDYEVVIKKHESDISSLTSVSGTFYAVYKKLFPLDMKNDLADDFIVPIHVKKLGLKVVLEPEAVCEEVTVVTEGDEMGKRIRITMQNIRGLIDQIDILNPFKYGMYSLLIASHKLGRLVVPALLLGILATDFFLSFGNMLFKAILACQILFYMVGFSFMSRKVKNKILNRINYFCLSNMSIFLGFVKFAKGKRSAFWETQRSE
jgi:cellulose synthase/poly-beta-1,6-N-acetylglucosamine synthase-like glycosyltransferase